MKNYWFLFDFKQRFNEATIKKQLIIDIIKSVKKDTNKSANNNCRH